MSENTPLTPKIEKLPVTRRLLTIDPLLIDLGKVFLMFLLYTVILALPIVILKRAGQDQAPWSPYLKFAFGCGVLVLTIRYSLKRFSEVKLNEVFRASKVPILQISAAVVVSVFALGVLLDQASFFVEDPVSRFFKKDLFTFITAVIAAPVLEEILCRGIVLKYLLGKTSPRMAIFYSALFFSLLHMNFYQGIPVFFVGLFLGWLFYRTKSIWPGMIGHFANNALFFILLVYVPEDQQSFLGVLGLPKYLALVVVSIFALVYCCKVIRAKTALNY